MSELKADLFLSEAMTRETALGNSKLKSASATITKDFSESLSLERQIKIWCKTEILQRRLLQNPYVFPLKRKKTEPQDKFKAAPKEITAGSIPRAAPRPTLWGDWGNKGRLGTVPETWDVSGIRWEPNLPLSGALGLWQRRGDFYFGHPLSVGGLGKKPVRVSSGFGVRLWGRSSYLRAEESQGGQGLSPEPAARTSVWGSTALRNICTLVTPWQSISENKGNVRSILWVYSPFTQDCQTTVREVPLKIRHEEGELPFSGHKADPMRFNGFVNGYKMLSIKQPGEVAKHKRFGRRKKKRGVGKGGESHTILLVLPLGVSSMEILPRGNLTSVCLYLISSFIHQLCPNHFLCISLSQLSSGCLESPVVFCPRLHNLFAWDSKAWSYTWEDSKKTALPERKQHAAYFK